MSGTSGGQSGAEPSPWEGLHCGVHGCVYMGLDRRRAGEGVCGLRDHSGELLDGGVVVLC